MKWQYFMTVGLFFTLASPLMASVDLDKLKEAKKKIEQRKKSLVEKKQKAKKSQAQLKKELQELFDRLFQRKKKLNAQEKIAALETLEALHEQLQIGSLEAYVLACDVFQTSQINYLEEAIDHVIAALDLPYPEEDYCVSLCGKYIGDDGLEYDDGIEDTEQEFVPFYSLPIHQWEKKVIEKLITYMAEKTLAQLLVDRKEMEKRGDQIFHVHPLRFLAHVMSDAYLKACVSQFRGKAFVWSHFIDGYAQKMRQEAANDNLIKHLESFAKYLNVEVEPLISFVNEGDFEGLVVYLLEV